MVRVIKNNGKFDYVKAERHMKNSKVVIETTVGFFAEPGCIEEGIAFYDAPAHLATEYPDAGAAREAVRKFRLDDRGLVAGLERKN
jgi:hypothetical protein